MGYLGKGAFDNDDAADWLASLKQRLANKQLAKALQAALDFSPDLIVPWSDEKIENFIRGGLAYYVKGIIPLPPEWQASGRSLEEFLEQEEKEEREYFASGRYLDEQYGPMEVAIAAAEMVAMWGGQATGEVTPYSQAAWNLVDTLKRKPVPVELVQLAIASIEKVLVNERYRRMRAFYLEAFPDMSGGDDAMAAVQDLFARLKRIELLAQTKKKRGGGK
ncbi:MAG: DUF4259 domain-containing protein [Xanthomonadales bacterium]|nr:DUF4259 domain-containing protein [Xanthomonadales bacterium]